MLTWNRDSESEKKQRQKTSSGKDTEPQKTKYGTRDSHVDNAHKRLGELLLEERLITKEQLNQALEIQSKTGRFLGKILIEKGFIDRDVLANCLSKQCRIPHIKLVEYDINSDVVKLIPEEVCRKRYLLPIDKLGRIVTVAMVDPLDTEALEEVKSHCPDLRIKPILCSWEDLEKAFEKAFRKNRISTDILSTLGYKTTEPEKKEQEVVDSVEIKEENPPLSTDVNEAVLEEIEKEYEEEIPEKVTDYETEQSQVAVISEPIPTPTQVIIDTSLVQAIQDLPKMLADSIRDSLTQVNINIPSPTVIPPPPSITPEHFAEFIGEMKNTFRESISQFAHEIHARLREEMIQGQNQVATMIQEGVSHVISNAVTAMLDNLKLELSSIEKENKINIEQIAETMREGIGEISQQLLNTISEEIRNSAQVMSQMSIEVTKSIGEVVQKIDQTDQKEPKEAFTPEKMQEVLVTVKESIVSGIQNTLEDAITKLIQELKETPEAEEPDPVLLSLTEAIQKLDHAIIENQKQQELQTQKMAQITESILRSVSETTTQTINEIKKERESENSDLAREKSIIEPLIPELKEVVQQVKESVQKTQEMHNEQTQKIARLTETTLESVQQTAQLVETLSIMEGKRVETLEEKKQRLASVAPFGKGSSTPPPEIEESDKEVWKALESEQPLETLTFDNFFPGTVNAFTFKLSKAVAENPGTEYNPFFLYGNVGIGKTHLISAIGNEILKKHPKMRVGYVSASHFSRRLAEALKEGALDLFRENYCHWDVLILDDIQFMGGKVEAQEEFFHVFNVLHQSKRQIIIASDKAPDRLGLLEQRLVSRFASGIVAELKSPEWETRMQILHNQVKMADVKVPEEVLSLIAMRVPNDIRKMMGSLKKIIAFAKLVGQNITCEMADEILSHLGIAAA
ncbi:MAG TPA: DnaA/Hda family protein [Candidatus Hydrogenedens sp.]|nr:DnaA/Hda family protein [Candidatus Hydrogenedens sp.]